MVDASNNKRNRKDEMVYRHVREVREGEDVYMLRCCAVALRYRRDSGLSTAIQRLFDAIIRLEPCHR